MLEKPICDTEQIWRELVAGPGAEPQPGVSQLSHWCQGMWLCPSRRPHVGLAALW